MNALNGRWSIVLLRLTSDDMFYQINNVEGDSLCTADFLYIIMWYTKKDA